MKKINFLNSGLIISLFLFGCSPSNKVKEYMLNDYQFSAAKDNANDIIRLIKGFPIRLTFQPQP